jgi:putative oxidoreductase
MNALARLHDFTTHYDLQLTEWGGSLLTLAIRLYVGLQFFKAGMTKISSWDSTLFLFRDEYSVPLLPPEVAAVAGTFGELVFPVLLFIGLFSRPAALAMFIVNAVAVISYPALFEFACPAALNDHITWGALLLVIVAFGPGRISLDRLIARRFD